VPEDAGRWGRVLVPVHWSFLLGQVVLWSLAVLVVTGVVLALFYRPGADPVLYTGSSELYDGRQLPQAFASVLRISEDLPGGLLLRRLHRVATHVFVVALVLHLLRILLTGAFRRPRTPNYLLGIVLLLLSLGLAYTGQNLPFELLAGASLSIGYTLAASLPFVGEELAELVFGGIGGADALVHLWVLHVFVLPVLLLGGVALHLLLVARQTHTRLPAEHDAARVALLAPHARSLLLGLLLLAVLLLAAALVPWSDVLLMGPYVAGQATNSLAPDWSLFWPDGAMRILPAIHVEVGPVVLTNPLVAGVLLPGALLTAVVGYPFLERLWRRRRPPLDTDVLEHPFSAPVRCGVVAAGLTVFVVLSLGVTDTAIAGLTALPVSTVVVALRVLLVLGPPLVGLVVWWYARRVGSHWALLPSAARPTSAGPSSRPAREGASS
jgi:quinol-cytochrome oxidoreductase complex cytochrome b subunit